jgi:hypothetical protein
MPMWLQSVVSIFACLIGGLSGYVFAIATWRITEVEGLVKLYGANALIEKIQEIKARANEAGGEAQ